MDTSFREQVQETLDILDKNRHVQTQLPPLAQPHLLRDADVQQVALLQQELVRRQLLLELQIQTTAQTVTAEHQLHRTVQRELEAYAQQLEQWVNQPGRSDHQQQYIHALADEMRDMFTRTVLERVELTSAKLTRQTQQDATLPHPPPPVVEVTPRQEDHDRNTNENLLIAWGVGTLLIFLLYAGSIIGGVSVVIWLVFTMIIIRQARTA